MHDTVAFAVKSAPKESACAPSLDQEGPALRHELDTASIRNYICYMKRSRMSVVLHALVHLVQADRLPVTSEHLAACLRTNPVVVRRDLAVLRQAGVVHSTAGPGGGWTLARGAEEITLRQVYAAVGEPLISLPTRDDEHPGCLLEARVHQALGDVYQEIDALLQQRLARLTLADLVLELPCHESVSAHLDTREIPHAV